MTIREVQMVSLEILKDVHQFCVQNNIKYSLSGGTLLGAIRHNGFIPWDDDIDIQMPYPEYLKFIHSYKSTKGYKLFSREIEGSENVMMRMGRVCDMERTYVNQGRYPWVNVDTGIWIDIIPVYGAPNNRGKMRLHYLKSRVLGKISNYWRIKHAPFSEKMKQDSLWRKIKHYIKKIIGLFLTEKSMDRYMEELRKYDYDKSDYFFAGPQNGMGEWQPKENMATFFLHPFEDESFFVMSGYDANLRGLFGDYMTLPPVEKRVPHSFFSYYWR